MVERPTWLEETALQQLFAATRVAGGEVRAVGGCVRDFLIGATGGDIDLASSLRPEQTIEIAAQHGWKAIPTGIAHGTVTLLLPNRLVEVTTLRRDVATDGRHAEIAYTDSWQEDAARRDFTFNAMSMDADGTLYDFFDGQQDVAARRVRFIGDAATRITEDALRMLRFFRFLASHGAPPADADALTAIRAHTALITALSGERIAQEMKKMLQLENPAFSLRLMAETGVAEAVFDRPIDPSRMIRLHLLEHHADYQCSVWARAWLLLNGEGIDFLPTRWKLSRHEAAQLALLASLPPLDTTRPRHTHTRVLRLHGAPAYLDWLLVSAARTVGIDIAPYVALAKDFVAPSFPVTAADLLARGMTEGKALGETLRTLEERWEMSDYTLSKADLLADETKA